MPAIIEAMSTIHKVGIADDMAESELMELARVVRNTVPSHRQSTDGDVLLAMLRGDVKCMWEREGGRLLVFYVCQPCAAMGLMTWTGPLCELGRPYYGGLPDRRASP